MNSPIIKYCKRAQYNNPLLWHCLAVWLGQKLCSHIMQQLLAWLQHKKFRMAFSKFRSFDKIPLQMTPMCLRMTDRFINLSVKYWRESWSLVQNDKLKHTYQLQDRKKMRNYEKVYYNTYTNLACNTWRVQETVTVHLTTSRVFDFRV
jgi:hypothetical protein